MDESMGDSLLGRMRSALNYLMRPIGFEVVRTHRWDEPRTYIPFKPTLAGAKKAGLSVGDYIDKTHNVLGTTQETMDQMQKLGVFDHTIDRVCEIGPGSGRYLEKTLTYCRPSHYEIYETAQDWAQWLIRQYPVVLRPTDGNSLSATQSASIDLLQAHKVFSVTPFLTTMRYLAECVRVLRPGGKLVFDLITDECMDDPALERWMATGPLAGTFPSVVSRQYAIRFFSTRGFRLDGEFRVAYMPGTSNYFVFTKF